MDPEKKMGMDDDASINKLQLQLLCQKIFISLFKHCPQFPTTLRAICSSVKDMVEKKFGQSSTQKIIGGFVFLRFICPAIVAPNIYGVVLDPPNSETQRHLLLVAKVLQNLSNGITFGSKEPFMAPLNDFISENLTKLTKFFDEITTLPHNWEELIALDRIDIPAAIIENSVSSLPQVLETQYKKIFITPEQLNKIKAYLESPDQEEDISNS